ncbi:MULTISPECIES: metal ABC transporter ATP-binding protein [Actinoalloteichus]|uniref:ATPase component of Mn/Zn ABC-type transporter n=1 Tax=Actinoalloteichus fjordicus TaxID=1612552 RepID=A0AAC9PRS4_9PSEU|nr:MULTISPECIES: ABC transporter ATP-binding protein [Actinoalloteichus]APU14315.1 ATPase component of Mn/Zn ABC-type transporter [Actinoalloteichus fjordicus]APU20284.1 ATPase component of Mn/Zn ABC-type transporter [Actinoalloteichus sp. GBA129-24]
MIRRAAATPDSPTPGATEPAPALVATGLTVGYRGRTVLTVPELVVPAGRLTAVVGPNGAGKSTLIKAALGLLPSTGGAIRLLGEPLARVRRRVAYVPQRDAVAQDFPVTAVQVVEMGRYPHRGWFRRLTREDDRAVSEAMLRTGVTDSADTPLDELSGGQRQRVFLARALAQQADLLVLDEPFAAVDTSTETRLLTLLVELCEQEGRSVLMVHHDLRTVQDHFDHAVLLSGRVIADGPVSRVLRPEHLEAAYGIPMPSRADSADRDAHSATPPTADGTDRTTEADVEGRAPARGSAASDPTAPGSSASGSSASDSSASDSPASDSRASDSNAPDSDTPGSDSAGSGPERTG